MCPEKGGLFICLQVCFSWLLKKRIIEGNTAGGVADTEHHMGVDLQNKEQMKTLMLSACSLHHLDKAAGMAAPLPEVLVIP